MAFSGSLGSSHGGSSPISPLEPLSPRSLPQWLRSSRPRTAITTNSKLKVILLAVLCVSLGWFITSILGPRQDTGDFNAAAYDPASIGLLEDPSGFGFHKSENKRPGIIGDPEQETEKLLKGSHKDPSVSGALSDLHHAVSSKIKSLNPYRSKFPAHHRNQTSGAFPSHNTTSLVDGETIHDGIKEEDRLGARVRIGKCTILFRGNDFWERCLRTHEQHDRHNGYRLHVLREEIMDDVWTKPAYILSLLLRELSKPPGDRTGLAVLVRLRYDRPESTRTNRDVSATIWNGFR